MARGYCNARSWGAIGAIFGEQVSTANSRIAWPIVFIAFDFPNSLF